MIGNDCIRVPSFLFDYDFGSIYLKRCRSIEKQLKKHNIDAIVSRHTLFDVPLYLVDVTRAKRSISDIDIAKALKIPKTWVNLYKCDKDLLVRAILEAELNDKYCVDEDSDLMFEFKLSQVKNQSDFVQRVMNRIDECGFEHDGAFYDKSSNQLFIKVKDSSTGNKYKLKNILGVTNCYNWISTLHNDAMIGSDGWFYINLSKVK